MSAILSDPEIDSIARQTSLWAREARKHADAVQKIADTAFTRFARDVLLPSLGNMDVDAVLDGGDEAQPLYNLAAKAQEHAKNAEQAADLAKDAQQRRDERLLVGAALTAARALQQTALILQEAERKQRE